MYSVSLDIHGQRFKVRTGSRYLLEQVAGDFACYRTEDGDGDRDVFSVTCGIRKGDPALTKAPAAGRGYRVLRGRGKSLVQYARGGKIYVNYSRKRAFVWADDGCRLHELARRLLVATAGRCLERRGLHRVHAFGIAARAGALLVMSKSGGGKTYYGMRIIEAGFGAMLSDDCPFIDSSLNVHSFALRPELREKDARNYPEQALSVYRRRDTGEVFRLLDLDYLPGRPAQGPVPLRWVAIVGGTRSIGANAVGRAEFFRVLCNGLVAGKGVTQARELVLRRERGVLQELCRALAGRLSTAARIARKVHAVALHDDGDLAELYRMLDS